MLKIWVYFLSKSECYCQKKCTWKTPGTVNLEEGADAVQRWVGDVLEVWVVEAAKFKAQSLRKWHTKSYFNMVPFHYSMLSYFVQCCHTFQLSWKFQGTAPLTWRCPLWSCAASYTPSRPRRARLHPRASYRGSHRPTTGLMPATHASNASPSWQIDWHVDKNDKGRINSLSPRVTWTRACRTSWWGCGRRTGLKVDLGSMVEQ